MATTQFEARYGFPRRAAGLSNWRTRPYSRWTFQNVSEIVPSASVSDDCEAEDLADPGRLLDRTFSLSGGSERGLDFLDRASTDSLVVMKRGTFVADWHAPTVDPAAPHLVFSIGKSLTAIVAGTLIDDGVLDPTLPVSHYLPEAAGSAYADCSVQNVLDMRVSLDFSETYENPTESFLRYRRSTLYNPGDRSESLLQFLMSLDKADGDHGGPFAYLSPNTDVLGQVTERASGARFPDLLRERVWRAVGAKGRCFVTVDIEGSSRTAGGISLTARDLARVGEMMRNRGMAGSRAVLSERFVNDTTRDGDTAAWLAGSFPYLFPDGAYRNCWYQTGYASGAFCAIGIHGQWLYVDPANETVIVKQSCQAEAVDDALDQDCLAFFRRIAEAA
ncbi:MAG: serine hydrolase [Rhizobiaceae bacterium]|nr:serine hydrolase [Rhizobiaceae bacterium]